MEVAYLPQGTFLSQKKFTHELLAQTGFATSTPTVTPLPLSCKLMPDDGFLLPDPTF